MSNPIDIIPYGEIAGYEFYLPSSQEIKLNSHAEVRFPDIFKDKIPQYDGIYDARLGTTDYGWNCTTCLENKSLCPGHNGHLDLKYPIIHPLLIKELVKILKCFCVNCGKLIVEEQRNATIPKLTFYAKIVTSMRKNIKCENCGNMNPGVKQDKVTSKIQKLYFKQARKGEKEVITTKVFHTHDIYQTLQRINKADMAVLGLGHLDSTKLVWNTLLIPANTVRPEIRRFKGNRVNNNEINTLLQTIVTCNSKLEIIGEPTEDQLKIIAQIDSSISAYIKGTNKNKFGSIKKPINGIAKGFSGKNGRVRRNLMGKRATNVSRSFITCDTDMEIDEIGIPEYVARKIGYVEVVTPHNIDQLKIYLKNGSKFYPGAKKITKANGRSMLVENLSNYVLEYGDIVHRDLITGDICCFNRQPSLEPSSISSMRIKVIPESKAFTDGKTFRMNVITCSLFGADFDGDAMNITFSNNRITTNEIDILASPGENFITYKNAKPKLGQVLDSVVGCAELTRSYTRYDKFHAMQAFSGTKITPKFDKKTYSGRDLMSALFKESNYIINYNGKPQFFDEVTAVNRKYYPDETVITIDKGELKSGVLDAASIGADTRGSIFHIIHNQLGPKAAMEAVFRVQQLAINHLDKVGLTVSMADLMLRREKLEEIHRIEDNLIEDSKRITRQLDRGNIVPPLGKTVTEHFENLQVNALDLNDRNTTFNKIILSGINLERNGLYKMINYGAKGKFAHLRNISSAVGQILINGERTRENFDGRTMAFYTRFDHRPVARGFIANNYFSGIDVGEFIAHAQESRYQLINTALSTAVTGEQNRRAIKNLEGIMANNLRQAQYNDRILQPLYGIEGADPRFIEIVRIPIIAKDLSDLEFTEKYRVKSSVFAKKYHGVKLDAVIEEEFSRLKNLRDKYVENLLVLETLHENVYDNTVSVPVNIKSIIDDTIFNMELHQEVDLDPFETYNMVKSFADNIHVILFNENFRDKVMPKYVEIAVQNSKIQLLSYLNLATIKRTNLTIPAIRVVLKTYEYMYNKNLVSYGKCIGIIAAQSISEPMTQTVLDSRHYSGVGGSKKRGMFRINEILGVKKDPKNPSMSVYIRHPYCLDKEKVQGIANEIEMMRLGDFINSEQVFYEEFGVPVHPNYINESKFIQQFLKYRGITKPSDVTRWCVRIKIDKSKMFEKNLSAENIYLKLVKQYPFMFTVYTVDNSESVIFRLYCKSGFNKGEISVRVLIAFIEDDLKNLIVRGLNGVVATYVKSIKRSKKSETGTITSQDEYFIFTEGTNLAEIVENPYVDPDTIQTDNILETKASFGIRAARNKIISELKGQIPGMNHRHYSMYADMMTFSGNIYPINRFGNNRRGASVLLRISDSSPITAIKEAAFHNVTDKVQGISPSLMVGKNPRIGSIYNTVILDTKFVSKHAKSDAELLETI